MPEVLVKETMELSGIYKNGYALEVTSVVKQVTGKKPRSISQFAKDYIESFK